MAHRSTLLGLAVPTLVGIGFAQTTERVSVDSSGNQGNDDSFSPSFSLDGRYVAFESFASNLVPGDTNGNWDVFVHDRQTGATERVSVDSSGHEANGESHFPSISADGRYVAFTSLASNLVPDDTDGIYDVFVHDRQTGTTERVSVDSSGNQGNEDSYEPSISGDGRHVAFESFASNLVPGDTNGDWDVFVHDRQTGATAIASVDSSGNQGDSTSADPSISGDGRYVAFWSTASNLVPGDMNGDADVFVHDRQTGATECASVDSSGNLGNDDSRSCSISGDGRHVAFMSTATNLVEGDTNDSFDVFVHDRQTGATERVSVDSSGNQGNSGSVEESVSGDGRYVAFMSTATNLVEGDTNSRWDVFLHDRQTGTTERASVDSSGNESNNNCRHPSISGDGRYVAFWSYASNLVPGDTNGDSDVFVRDRATSFEVYCTAGTSASGCQASMSASGTASASAASGFVLSASGVEGAKDGLFFFGTNGVQANPWGNGTSLQCVVPPVVRAALLSGTGTVGSCDGMLAQDLNALWCPSCPKPQANPGAAGVVQAQLWYRDPFSTSNQTTSLSDALEFSVAP